MHSKFQTTILQGNSLNSKHSWIGGNPIYCASEEGTLTLALIEDYLADQRDGMDIFHVPFPSAPENHLLWYLRWLKTKPGSGILPELSSVSGLWALCIMTGSSLVILTERGTCARRKKKAQRSNPLNVQIGWLHPQLSGKHFYTVMKGNWA